LGESKAASTVSWETGRKLSIVAQPAHRLASSRAYMAAAVRPPETSISIMISPWW
jgi:hypothetical protein